MSEKDLYLVIAAFRGADQAKDALEIIPEQDKNYPTVVILVKDQDGHVTFKNLGQTPGKQAAKGVALLRGRHYRRVLLLAPSHYGGFHGLSIAGVSAYRTPLGEVPLDRQAVQRLRASPLVGDHPAAHRREHSIEIELPLLQQALAPGWSLVPILVGRLERDDYPSLAALESFMREAALSRHDTYVLLRCIFGRVGLMCFLPVVDST